MSNHNGYTLGYAFGFTLTATFLCAVSYIILAPFGIGYVGAELMAAYLGWITISKWDFIVAHYQSTLDELTN